MVLYLYLLRIAEGPNVWRFRGFRNDCIISWLQINREKTIPIWRNFLHQFSFVVKNRKFARIRLRWATFRSYNWARDQDDLSTDPRMMAIGESELGAKQKGEEN